MRRYFLQGQAILHSSHIWKHDLFTVNNTIYSRSTMGS